VTPSVAAPGDTNLSDATARLYPPLLLLCLRSDSVIVGHINRSCYLLTYSLLSWLSLVHLIEKIFINRLIEKAAD